jgi:uncharacterized SAM-binding protein YcdF (DUF218 family)
MRCDRWLIAVLGVLAAAVGLLLDGHPLWRLILAAPLVLVLPGAALSRLFPGRLPAPGRYALTGGLSIAVCLLGGLLLNAVGALTTPGWFVLLSVVSLAGALAAPHPHAAISWSGLVLRPRHGVLVAATLAAMTLTTPGWFVLVSAISLAGALATPHPHATISQPWSGLALRPRHGVMVAATLVAMTVTLGASLRNHAEFHPFAFTDFWMVPIQSGSTGYQVGIRNQERRPEVVTLRVTVDGALVGVWRDIAVAPGETVLKGVALPEGRKAEAVLLRTGSDNTVELFRKVSALLPRISTVAEKD